MKLDELVIIQNGIYLREVLNTRVPIGDWVINKDNPTVKQATLCVDDSTFQLQIAVDEFQFNDKTITYAQLGFGKFVDGKLTGDMQYGGKTASKVIGAITNAMDDFIKRHDLDAVVVVAKDNVETRTKVYHAIGQYKMSPQMATHIVELQNGARLLCFLKPFVAQPELFQKLQDMVIA